MWTDLGDALPAGYGEHTSGPYGRLTPAMGRLVVEDSPNWPSMRAPYRSSGGTHSLWQGGPNLPAFAAPLKGQPSIVMPAGISPQAAITLKPISASIAPTAYGAPPTAYGAPPTAYGAPPTAYGAPIVLSAGLLLASGAIFAGANRIERAMLSGASAAERRDLTGDYEKGAKVLAGFVGLVGLGNLATSSLAPLGGFGTLFKKKEAATSDLDWLAATIQFSPSVDAMTAEDVAKKKKKPFTPFAFLTREPDIARTYEKAAKKSYRANAAMQASGAPFVDVRVPNGMIYRWRSNGRIEVLPGSRANVGTVYAPGHAAYPSVYAQVIKYRKGNVPAGIAAGVMSALPGALPMLFPKLAQGGAPQEDYMPEAPAPSSGIPAVAWLIGGAAALGLVLVIASR